MKELTLVFIGSGIGGVFRYLIYLLLNKNASSIPIYTLIANLLACFIVGFTLQKFTINNLQEAWRLLIIVGFCGGLSTYSSFNFELSSYLQKSELILFIFYSGLTFVGCLLAFYLGTYLAQNLKY